MIKQRELKVSNIWNLIIGILYLIPAIFIEYSCINWILNNKVLFNAICVMALVQVVATISFCYAAEHLLAYKTKGTFLMFSMEINNNTSISDIVNIKENYYIVDMCSDGVIYIEKEDYKKYISWSLLNKFTYHTF